MKLHVGQAFTLKYPVYDSGLGLVQMIPAGVDVVITAYIPKHGGDDDDGVFILKNLWRDGVPRYVTASPERVLEAVYGVAA